MKVTAYKTLEGQVERAASYLGKVKLGDIDSDVVQQMIFSLAEQGYSESVMTKAKIAVGSVLKMAVVKHYIDTVPVFNITIPRAKSRMMTVWRKRTGCGTMKWPCMKPSVDAPMFRKHIPNTPEKR